MTLLLNDDTTPPTSADVAGAWAAPAGLPRPVARARVELIPADADSDLLSTSAPLIEPTEVRPISAEQMPVDAPTIDDAPAVDVAANAAPDEDAPDEDAPVAEAPVDHVAPEHIPLPDRRDALWAGAASEGSVPTRQVVYRPRAPHEPKPRRRWFSRFGGRDR